MFKEKSQNAHYGVVSNLATHQRDGQPMERQVEHVKAICLRLTSIQSAKSQIYQRINLSTSTYTIWLNGPAPEPEKIKIFLSSFLFKVFL